MAPKLSVVVPFYNVEPYFEECLDSLARQRLQDLEVIMVDDGSLDGSAVIAKSFAEKDPRFVLVQQENQGLGPARNTGARHARGRYLAFMDSDDVVPSDGYELLVASLERTGSDIACGGVRRLSSSGLKPTGAHRGIFQRTEEGTHVTRRPDLLRDRTAWNKVFRKAFWDEHGFAFPPGLYEDIPVIIPAHVLARKVDLLRNVVYHWRVREGGDLSITQRRTEPGNMEARVDSMISALEFMRERDHELLRPYLNVALTSELPLFVEIAHDVPDEYLERLRQAVVRMFEYVDERALAEIPALARLKYHLILQGRLADFVEVLRFQRDGRTPGDIVRKGVLRPRWYATYPCYGGDVPEEVFDVSDELELVGRVDDITWNGDRLVIEGHARVAAKLAHAEPGDLRVWLQEPRKGTRISLAIEPTAGGGADGPGFRAELPIDRLKTDGKWRPATWEVHAEVKTRGLKRSGALTFPRRGELVWQEAAWPTEMAAVRAIAKAESRFAIRVEKRKALVGQARFADGELVLTGWTTVPGDAPAHLLVGQGSNVDDIRVPVTFGVGEGQRRGFSARVPLTVLGTDDAEWSVHLNVEGDPKNHRVGATDALEARSPAAAAVVEVSRTARGHLRILRRSAPVVSSASWDGERLVLGTDGIAEPGILELRRRGIEERPAVAGSPTPEGHVYELDATSLPGEGVPEAPETWEILHDGAALPATANVLSNLPGERVAGGRSVRLGASRQGSLTLHIEPA